MNAKSIVARVIALIAFFILGAVVRPSVAAPAAPNTILFGSVDIQKVIAKYTKTSAMNAQIQEMEQQYNDVIKTQAANPMLGGDDQQRLSDLLVKPTHTDADNAAIAVLQQKSQKDSQDLATLQQKKDLTDQDKIRMQQLTDEAKAGQAALQDQADKYKANIQDKNAELGQQVADDIRVAVAYVAQQKGLAAVFDSQFAIYTSSDVTQAVINKLNGTK